MKAVRISYTHGDKMIPISAMVYFINDPDSHARFGRAMISGLFIK